MPSEVPTSNCEEWIDGKPFAAVVADSCSATVAAGGAAGGGGREGEDKAKGTLELNSVSCSSATATAATSWSTTGDCGGEELNIDGTFEENSVRSSAMAVVASRAGGWGELKADGTLEENSSSSSSSLEPSSWESGACFLCWYGGRASERERRPGWKVVLYIAVVMISMMVIKMCVVCTREILPCSNWCRSVRRRRSEM